MCKPIFGLVGGLLGMNSRSAPAPAQPDPAAERAAAEAEATQSANTRLAATQRRRREQSSLLSKGAPDAAPAPTVLFGDQAKTQSGGSLMSRGQVKPL